MCICHTGLSHIIGGFRFSGSCPLIGGLKSLIKATLVGHLLQPNGH